MNLRIELEREAETGRWIADCLDLPGCMTYGATYHEAKAKVKALAYRILAEKIEHEGHYDTGAEWLSNVPDGVEELPPGYQEQIDKHVGSTFESFLEERGIRERVDKAVETCRERIEAGKPAGDYVGSFAKYANDDVKPLLPNPLLVVIQQDEDGAVCVACNQIGAFTNGKTIQEACANMGEAIERALDIGCDEPVAYRDLFAPVVLGPEASERLAEALEDDSGPSPAMKELFEKYGKRDTTEEKVTAALKDVPGIACILRRDIPPKPASKKFYIVFADHNMKRDGVVTGRLWDLGPDVDYDLVPQKGLGMVPPSTIVMAAEGFSEVCEANGHRGPSATPGELIADLNRDDGEDDDV